MAFRSSFLNTLLSDSDIILFNLIFIVSFWIVVSDNFCDLMFQRTREDCMEKV